jgi:hypothetical protein
MSRLAVTLGVPDTVIRLAAVVAVYCVLMAAFCWILFDSDDEHPLVPDGWTAAWVAITIGAAVLQFAAGFAFDRWVGVPLLSAASVVIIAVLTSNAEEDYFPEPEAAVELFGVVCIPLITLGLAARKLVGRIRARSSAGRRTAGPEGT